MAHLQNFKGLEDIQVRWYTHLTVDLEFFIRNQHSDFNPQAIIQLVRIVMDLKYHIDVNDALITLNSSIWKSVAI